MMNIRSFVHDVLPHNIRNFNKKNTLLEASFIVRNWDCRDVWT